MKRFSMPLVATGLVLALAGCGAGKPGDAQATPEPTVTVAGLPEGVVGATDVPVDVPNDVETRKNASIETCEASNGGWTAAGTMKNTSDEEATYTITVFFTTATATVLATGGTEVTVPSGESGEWSISAEFTAPEGTTCVLRGVA